MEKCVSINREEVLRVARLVELDVPEHNVASLVRDIASIVEYVSQLTELPVDDGTPPFVPGPKAVRLRRDEVRPTPLARTPAEMAPEFIDGFFVVPLLDAMEEE